MSTYKKRIDFLESEEGVAFKNALLEMTADSRYATEPSYSANTTLYSDNRIPFIDKHILYLQAHPQIDPEQYLANLRLITKLRT